MYIVEMDRRVFLGATATAPLLLQAQAEDGFISLFDGKTLNAWTIQEGPETAFYVDDGAIVVQESSGFPTWLRSASPRPRSGSLTIGRRYPMPCAKQGHSSHRSPPITWTIR